MDQASTVTIGQVGWEMFGLVYVWPQRYAHVPRMEHARVHASGACVCRWPGLVFMGFVGFPHPPTPSGRLPEMDRLERVFNAIVRRSLMGGVHGRTETW